MNPFDLDGKHIAISGASSGFGHHFAGVLSDAGAKVSLGARRTDKIEDRVEQINSAGGQAFGARLDVTDGNSITEFFAAAEGAFGPVHVLINNAGIEAGAKTYMMIDEDDWDSVIDTNLKSAWLMSKRFTERVVANELGGGNIINVSSITDTRTIKGQFPYAVSKGGLTRMTEILALEAPRYGVRVNALAPGYILTDVSRVLLESEQSPEFMKGIPLRRYGSAAEVAGPISFLCGPESAYMTGTVLNVTGGVVLAG